MIAAKKLEYEAFKEIMPDGLRAHVDLMEEQVMDTVKDMAYSYFFDNMADASGKASAAYSNTKSARENQEQPEKDTKEEPEEAGINSGKAYKKETGEEKETWNKNNSEAFAKAKAEYKSSPNRQNAPKKQTRTKKIEVE